MRNAKFQFFILTPIIWLFVTQSWSQTAASNLATTPNVAVIDITAASKDLSAEDVLMITGRFETELMKTEQFNVLERRNMTMILQEQGFQQSGACNSSECQVQVGQILGVDRIITGVVSKMGNLYTLNLKMVDVEKGQNIMSHALDVRGDLEDVIRGGCYEMAQILSGLKKPEKSHSVLTAEKSSWWPWVAGGVLAAGAVITTVVIMNQPTHTQVKAIVE